MTSAGFFPDRLLPGVRQFVRLGGECPVPTHFQIEVEDRRVRQAVERWLARKKNKSAIETQPVRITMAVDTGVTRRDGYRVLVEGDGIRVLGNSPAGCYYGLHTLEQLAAENSSIPCCEIADWPDFATRGLLHDTTRGKVPTLGTLKRLADRLAALRINQLQLYMEHSFVFAFDATICNEQDGLTAGEIRELDYYCRERFIDLVPAVATLGHMGRILSLPHYRHLAEIEPTLPWKQLPWPQRARGFTLDVLNTESHRLVERIWSEILDAFLCPIVNICGDEPWDLARGRNKDKVAADQIGELYVDAILRTHAICARRGRKTQVWSDVVRNHPELFERLPHDLAVLHWGYDDRSDYAGTRAFVDAGLETICCPGTTGWKRMLNAMELAERNIATFADAGKCCGATGLINTDWGDHGHFNALACSWHGIALGAARAWNADHAIGSDFDRRFTHWMFDADEEEPDDRLDLMDALRATSKIADTCETWRLFWQPMEQIRTDATLPALIDVEAASHSANHAIRCLRQLPDGIDRDELVTACESTLLFCDKVRLARGETVNREAAIHRMNSVVESFMRNWHARNKPSGLRDILGALDRTRAEIE